MLLQRLVAEPCANFTNGLIFFTVGIIACEEESAVDVRAFALTIVASYDY